MISPAKFDEAELVTLIDRLVRSAPGLHGGSATVRQITQKQEKYRGGYDAVVSSVIPFYVQAKTASFYPENSRSDIIRIRNDLGVNCSPGAFAFPLRRHDGTDEPLQHNALFWLSLRSMAGYVCPTFVSESTLERRLNEALTVQRHQIWTYDDLNYFEQGGVSVNKIRTKHFRGLITIIPHRLVDNYKHRYSYTNELSPDVVFHSEPEKVKGVYNFGKFIEEFFLDSSDFSYNQKKISIFSVDEIRDQQLKWIEEALENKAEGVRITPADASLALATAGISSVARFQRPNSVLSFLKKMDWMDVAAFYGGLLKEKYSIRQILIMNNVP